MIRGASRPHFKNQPNHKQMDFRATFCQMSPKGQIQLIMGGMFSGKSTELMRRFRRYLLGGKRCILLKYADDTRYCSDNVQKVVTHDRISEDAVAVRHLYDVDVSDFDVICIDEGQFMKDLVGFCDEMARGGKVVVVAGLDGSFLRKPFQNIAELIPLADHVDKLTAICMRCGNDAPFTKCISQETEFQVIGGADKYEARCRTCFDT